MNTSGPDHNVHDWDRLVDRSSEPTSQHRDERAANQNNPSTLTLMAASWADLVSILAVCTAGLAAILAIGERPALPAFTWAMALAVLWWLFAASVLVVVRHATPGMLLAGVSFSGAIAPERVAWTLAAALSGVVTLGVSGVVGGENSILCRAGGSRVVDSIA